MRAVGLHRQDGRGRRRRVRIHRGRRDRGGRGASHGRLERRCDLNPTGLLRTATGPRNGVQDTAGRLGPGFGLGVQFLIDMVFHLRNGSQRRYQAVQLRAIRKLLQERLEHVVAKVVLVHGRDRIRALAAVSNQLLRGLEPNLRCGMHDALLDHVGGELVLGQGDDPAQHAGNHPFLVRGQSLRNDVLDHVVGKLARDEKRGRLVKLGNDGRLVSVCAMLQQALDDPAGKLIRREFPHPAAECAGDEVQMLTGDRLDHHLEHMVAGLVPKQVHDIWLERFGQFDPLSDEYGFQSLRARETQG